MGTEWLIEMCACFQLSSLSDLISPESFLMPIIVCLFLCLLVCLGPFLLLMFPELIPFFPSVLLFYVSCLLLFLSSVYSTLSFSGFGFLVVVVAVLSFS